MVDLHHVDRQAEMHSRVIGSEAESRHRALAGVLAVHPDAIVAALADDGFRIAMPDAFPLGDHRALPLPDERATMLDVIVEGDRIAVVAAWERARKQGVGVAAVHALSDPDTRLTLSMHDVCERYGVWVAVLSHDGDEIEANQEGLAGPLIVPARPRQATMHKNMTAVITDVDDNVCRMFGWSREQLLGARSSEFIHPDDQARAVSTWMALLASRVGQRVRFRHRCRDGGWLWVEIENIHNGATDPDQVDVVAHVSDISDEMAAHEALRHREQLFSRLAEALPTGVLQLGRDGSVVYANARLAEVLHLGDQATVTDPFAHIASPDRLAVQRAIRAALEQGADGELEVEVCAPRARRGRRCSLTIAAVDDQEGQPGALVCVSDVTEGARLREELRVQATHDPLTGCLNRSAVLQALQRMLARLDADEVVAVFVDVDNFKPINDRLGHAAGDELLTALAARLQRACRDSDLVARLGGDEFLIVCHGPNRASEAAAIGDRVRRALNRRVALSSGEVMLQASIGIACPRSGHHGRDACRPCRQRDVRIQTRALRQTRPVFGLNPGAALRRSGSVRRDRRPGVAFRAQTLQSGCCPPP